MADTKTRARVARLRQSRKLRGECETNVWLPGDVRTAIDRAVKAGAYPSRRIAIAQALKTVFLDQELRSK